MYVKKGVPLLLRLLMAGLASYGCYCASIYLDYGEIWGDFLPEEKQARSS
jgi:hypothetical protein